MAKDQAWEDYKLEYNKHYTAEEEPIRHANWKKEVEEVELHNAMYGSEFTQAVNEMSDLSEEEYEQIYLQGLRVPEKSSADSMWVPANEPIPNEVDWRSQGLVAPIKNQGQCGSCYSFSATGALEGAVKKSSGIHLSLSEQEIVDCSGRYGNYGCRGGWYMAAWKYIRDIGGSACESKYPYVASKGWCRWTPSMRCATVSTY